ncbi:MAG: DUF87 domain-containing protein [Candidatus Dadabacteria bacterium]|nr:MAG: DUF87 domain-containing protein [Candidatus Dadabacteria bacterium]
MYVLGTSGTGKSKLIELLIAQDMQKGHGAAVLDPHGDLVENVLKLVPKHRVEDVIVFDPSDTSYPPSLNPFELVEEDGRMRVAAGLIEIFKLRFAHEWSERLEHLLRYTILALLSTQWTTVLSIKKMLLDESYRAAVIANVKDRVVKDFWEREFPEWYAKYYDSVILPLLSQVNDFAGSPMLHNSLGQPFNKFDFRKIMDARKILLMKVSKRLLGEDNAALLGSMIITRIYQAAMSRANVPFEERPDFFFYVDEFNEFATASFEEILSESRKYRLNLTITNQFLDQLPAPIRKTIFGNVGNIVAFKTSTEDSSVLSGELHPRVDASDLVNLAPREFFIKMSIKGQSHEPFSGRTLSVEYPEKNFATECIENSRAQYCLPKEQAEEIISTWADVG